MTVSSALNWLPPTPLRGISDLSIAAASEQAVYARVVPPEERTLLDVFLDTAYAYPDAPALDDGRVSLSYRELLAQVVHGVAGLIEAHVGVGDRVGVQITSGTHDLYIAILSILAAGAAYVPVDADDPAERAHLVWSEAGVCGVVRDGLTLTLRPDVEPRAAHHLPTPDDDAWVIFTSGTTGKPKGVAVSHRSAAAFVDAEARLFVQDAPLGPGDRVLAGLSVAFDASCEEMWLAWRHGGCLVPAPRSLMRTGPELVNWLAQRGITVVSTVPTMASLWPADLLSGIRLLVLGGEACPAGLADRLAARCAEVWNTYGPTEGTVVSSAARLFAGQPVRIGLPLAGWQLAVVDPASGRPVPWGGVGELVIGGVGVARYLDAELDARRFAPVEALGPGRAYRSGDLVRADREGLAYVGRADSQVKIRGYRIELSEIESVLLQVPGVAQAAVTTCQPQPGVVELAAYYSLGSRSAGDQDAGDGVAPVTRQGLADWLRQRLPAHMVPAFVEELPVIPLLPSGKADRKSLPAPVTDRRLVADRPHVPPLTPVEALLAESLADTLGLEKVSADSHFFEDLGLSSLLVAHFCARVRERAGATFPSPSTRDVYLHPTVQQLADVVSAASAAAASAAAMVPIGSSTVADVSGCESTAEVRLRSRTQRLGAGAMALCGVAQFVVFLASLAVGSSVMVGSLSWVSAAHGWTALYLRSLAFTTGLLVGLCVLPIAAKWVLVGRWTPRRIRVWSPAYLRFWLVRTILHASPLALMSGSPLYLFYLRALGAKIGRRVVILSGTLPVCTDMLSIGDDTVIRHGASFFGYRARDGVIETGPVTIGHGAFIGEGAVLDLGTVVGDGAQLGNSSSLHEGQAVPPGARWHGSPAQPADVDYRRVEPLRPSALRRMAHASGQVLALVFVVAPAIFAVSGYLITRPEVAQLSAGGPRLLSGTGFYLAGLIVSTVFFFGSLLGGAVVVLTVPRLLRRLITPGRVYPLYGVHYFIHRTIRRLTNIPFYLHLLGDSSFVVGYLRAVGYRMRDVEQTGSNFGASIEHENPFLVEIGRGTTVADGALLLNADYSTTSFRVSPVSIGARNFLGNLIAYPAGGRTGENCLIATKAMVPLDGPVRHDVGLLGSPCFEIPRSVTNDSRFDHLKTGEEFRRRLAAKNRHNIATIGLFLALRWLQALGSTLIAMALATEYRWTAGPTAVLGVAATLLAMLVFSFAYAVLVERAVCGFRRLTPRHCSIYDPYFWWHERFWKLQAEDVLAIFNGTPLKGLVWRLVGVKVGKRLFDDGCVIHERSLVTIGDDCTLNHGALIQCHSMEDGTFKSDHTVLGDGCTIGVNALVHYGVRVGDAVTLQPDSFLMKGETVPAGARWGGNPARPL